MRRLRRLNRLSESNDMVGDIDFWKNEDDRVYEKCLNTLMEFVADYDWWDFVYDRFEEDMEEKFGADVDLKNTYFSLDRNRYFDTEISLGEDAVVNVLKHERVKTPLLALMELGVVICYGMVDKKGFGFRLEAEDVDDKLIKKSSKIVKKSGHYAKAIRQITNDGYTVRDSGDERDVTEVAINLLIYDDESIIEDAIEDWYADVTGDVLNDLESEYDGMMSEEYLVDFARANEYEFDEDGELA